MATLLVFALVAGVLTILSPCTLPVVPLVLGASTTGRGRRLGGLFLGFGITFVGLTVIVAEGLAAAGITTSGWRIAAAALVGFFGATLAIPSLGSRMERCTARLAALGHTPVMAGPQRGFGGGFVLGTAIGLIWAPCVGPIMAAVIATAATAGPSAAAALIAGAYVIGAALPLALIAIGGRRVIARLGSAQRRARIGQSMGVVMVVASALVITGLDVPLQVGAASFLPAELTAALRSVEQQPAITEELQVLRSAQPATSVQGHTGAGAATPDAVLPEPVASALPAVVPLDDLGRAPALAGISTWINSDPLTLESLRGKVVLVHFWTFGCINCIHVQPYVKAWYDRYEAAGFVVIGVHSPELSFERDLGNLRDAVSRAGVRFPVAVDAAFATWNAYANQYWPAFYFVDKSGRIRHVHFGEGDYDGSEQVIRELLAEPG